MKQIHFTKLKKIIEEETRKVIVNEISKFYWHLMSEWIKSKKIVLKEEAGVSEEVKQYADIIMKRFFEVYKDAQFVYVKVGNKEAGFENFVKKQFGLRNPIEGLSVINFSVTEFDTQEEYDKYGKNTIITSNYESDYKKIEINGFSVLETNDFTNIRMKLEHELMHFYVDKKTSLWNEKYKEKEKDKEENKNNETIKSLYDKSAELIEKLEKDPDADLYDINYVIAQLIYYTDKNEVQANCQKLGYEIEKKHIMNFTDLRKRSEAYGIINDVEFMYKYLKYCSNKLHGEYDIEHFNNVEYNSLLNFISIKLSYLRMKYDRTAAVAIDKNNGKPNFDNVTENNLLNFDFRKLFR